MRASAVLRPVAAGVARRWAPHSRLLLVGEGARWSIDHDLLEVARLAAKLGVRTADARFLTVSHGQAAFFGSQFTLLRKPWRTFPHSLGTAYFHGRPGTPGMPEFDVAYEMLRARHSELARIQVTHAEMHDLVLSSGIDAAKVFRIPIGVNTSLFATQTREGRDAARRRIGLPAGAFVVGSFQKDGVGWGDGAEPKLIKGPDVLIDALRVARERNPDLHVLLSGPARGYVRAALEQLAIPYVHRRVERYEDVAELYLALDVYVIPSRQEGGPKGVLEAMASGVPVVSTRVGQAAEMIRDGENGWLVDVEDAAALGERLAQVDSSTVAAGVETACANAYDAQEPLWRAFFDGFVAHA